MSRLLHSSKFWMLVLDTVVAGATFFIGKYAGASSEDMLFLIGLLQPVVVALILGTAHEDAAQKAGVASLRHL